jgi:putative endonuclease
MFISKKAKAAHIKLGERGEKLARAYLYAKNIEPLLLNYQSKKGEIDIIARDGEEICFIEVKTRRYTTRSRPSEGLSEAQKLRISQAANSYLYAINNPEVIYRFDLIEIIIGRWDIVELCYWREYFQGEKRYNKN